MAISLRLVLSFIVMAFIVLLADIYHVFITIPWYRDLLVDYPVPEFHSNETHGDVLLNFGDHLDDIDMEVFYVETHIYMDVHYYPYQMNSVLDEEQSVCISHAGMAYDCVEFQRTAPLRVKKRRIYASI